MLPRRIIRIAPAILALAMLIITAVPVLAGPPEHETIPIDKDEFVLAVCDGFDVMDEYEGTRQRTTFFDQDGNIKKIVEHNKVRDRIYNSETGFEVHSRWANTVLWDSTRTNWEAITGLGWNVTVPGYGAVWFEAHHCTNDPDSGSIVCHGKDLYDEDGLCEAMNQ